MKNLMKSVIPIKAMNCSGDGSCLQQTDDGDGYEESDCIHNCQPVKCVNNELFESELPQWLAYKRIQTPICIYCDVLFAGPLQFVEKVEEYSTCLNNQDHKLVIICLIRFFFSN